MPLINTLYRAVKRFIPLDATHVFYLPADANHKPLAISENMSCKLLSIDELRTLSSDDEFAISPQFLHDVSEFQLKVVGSQINNTIVGMSCFALGEVPAHLNTGGQEFQGIGLKLPQDTGYLFKVFVKGEHRGKRLVSLMIQYAMKHEQVASGRSIVTTSDINNRAFRSSIMRLGFDTVGIAAETIMFGKHFFKLPAPIPQAQKSDALERSNPIILTKPEPNSATKAEPA